MKLDSSIGISKILYLGSGAESSTARHRADALRRIGVDVTLFDPWKIFRERFSFPWGAIHYRTGYRWCQNHLMEALDQSLPQAAIFDMAWIDNGDFAGRRLLQRLRRICKKIVVYNVDDATGRRDGGRWSGFVRALPEVDLFVAVRKETREEALQKGARHAMRVWRSYDEVVHRPLSPEEADPRFDSEVAFVGSWMENRGTFMRELVERGVPLTLWGDHWAKAPEWPKLRALWRGGAVYGRDYVRALAGAKISLGLLSKGNRDLHTQRSAEAPYAGALFCAERTAEHQELYQEGVEAVFWRDAQECASVCLKLLADATRRERIRQAGMTKVRALQLGNEDICRQILKATSQL
jgi:hypothetical protein